MPPQWQCWAAQADCARQPARLVRVCLAPGIIMVVALCNINLVQCDVMYGQQTFPCSVGCLPLLMQDCHIHVDGSVQEHDVQPCVQHYNDVSDKGAACLSPGVNHSSVQRLLYGEHAVDVESAVTAETIYVL